jgi:prepilin-type N-terminal cleavage/methylation domain-containing protein
MSARYGERGYTLIEVTIASVILALLLTIVGNYLFSAERTVASSAAHQDDNAAAQTVLGLIQSNVRFACDMSIYGGSLYVENSCGGSTPPCTEWSQVGTQLIEKTPNGSSAVANGVSNLSFTTNSSYYALVTVQFNLRQPQDKAGDPGGISAIETLTARNMPGTVGSTALC